MSRPTSETILHKFDQADICRSFQGGSSFICFKNSSEVMCECMRVCHMCSDLHFSLHHLPFDTFSLQVKAWGNKIRENIAELNNLPLKEQFFKVKEEAQREGVIHMERKSREGEERVWTDTYVSQS